MKYRYSKFTGEDLDGLDLEELLSRLSDMLLSSGFESPYGLPYDDDEPGHSMQSLHDAILEAMLNGGMLSDETLEKLLGKDWQQAEDAEERLDELIQRIIEKLQHQGYLTGQPEARESGPERPPGPGRRRRRPRRQRSLRDHRQEPRLPRLPRAARPARINRQEQHRPPRYARDGHRHRGERRAQAVRVRRHDEHRRQQHDPQRGQAAGERRPAGNRSRLRGPDGRPGRVSELVRDGPDARLQPQHDPLRRGSLHAGQAGRAGARQPDPPAIPGRRAEGRALPRFGRRDPAQPARARAGRARTTPTPARGSGSRGGSSSGSRRTCGRSS